MNNIIYDIFGGAKVRRRKARLRMPRVVGYLAVALLISFLYSAPAFAQGSIFGTVANADLSIPANGQISFYGFLDDTDEEIRIETSVGAGYDAGNWFDDFQNYLTEAPGNPYDYYFFNITNGEGFIQSDLIPNNSFQQENVSLAPVSWPMMVTGITGRVISSNSLVVTWIDNPGMTFHVYRRLAGSNGSFFRIDDPSGNMANFGVGVNYFVDNATDGISSYNYLVIADDGAGNLSPHSAIFTINSSGAEAPIVTQVTPPNGSYVGGTTITIEGIGFDLNGVTVDFGGGPLASITGITPYAITGVTPSGTVGPVDIIVTNNASGLVSVPLIGGFTYDANGSPILTPIGPQVIEEGQTLDIIVTATDPDATIPALLTSTPLPAGALFTDMGGGNGFFTWTPTFTDAGPYQVTFYAADEIDTVFEVVDITVNEAGNQPPVLAAIGALQILEGASLVQNISASDVDGDIPGLFAENMPLNASFVDSGNGIGTFFFDPDTTQQGFYDITFFTSDGEFADTEIVNVEVLNLENQAPTITPLADTTINEGDSLILAFNAIDPEGIGIVFTAFSDLGTFGFIDSGNGIGVLSYGSDFYSSGVYTVIASASDLAAAPLAVADTVLVTVLDVNQPPVIAPIDPQGVSIGDTLWVYIYATDDTRPDTTILLNMSHTGLPPNASFVDNGDNTAAFSFVPDATQLGVVSVTFTATDNGIPALADQVTVDINVVQENRPPEITVDPYGIVNEGDHLEMPVSAIDPDGITPILTIDKNPDNSSFVDNGDGTGLFIFDPSFVQSGLHRYEVRAYDGIVMVKKNVLIQVIEAGNQAPAVDPLAPVTVIEGETAQIVITATDPDNDPLTLTADSLPDNATFTDNGDNTGTIDFTPDFVQSGTYDVYIIATDGEFVDTSIVTITVDDAGPQAPFFFTVDSIFVDETIPISLIVPSGDPDGVAPILTAENLPAGATFVDNQNFTGSFNWTPDNFSDGEYTVTFIATDVEDANLTDTLEVVITVVNVNQSPQFAIVPDVSVDMNEGDTVTQVIYTQDADGSIPIIRFDSSLYSLVPNMYFHDSGTGVATFTFIPDYSQGATSIGQLYQVSYIVMDSEDTTIVLFTSPQSFYVHDVNGPPSFVTLPPSDTSIAEGEILSITVEATDAALETVPLVTAENLPPNATITGPFPHQKTFAFQPDFAQAGNYTVSFIANDQDPRGALADTVFMNITVTDAGNQSPEFTMGYPDTIICLVDIDTSITVTAFDPDQDPITLTVDTVINFATFADQGNGVGVYQYSPNQVQLDSLYTITFTASDVGGASTEHTYYLRVIDVMRGDANYDNQLNMLDIVFIINFLYKDGSSPATPDAADANYDTNINVLDASYLIDFFYRGGPAPPSN